MYNYSELLFDSPIPFIIVRCENNNLEIIHKNTKFDNLNYDLSYIENNKDIKNLINLPLEPEYKEIDIKYLDREYTILAKKISQEELIIWFKLKENQNRLVNKEIYDTSCTNFLSNLIHEFKTPLNLIFSSMQLLNKKIDNKNLSQDNLKKYLNIINQNSYRMLKLVNNIVDDSKIDIGHDELNLVNYDIVYFIESICESVDYFIKLNNMTLIFDTDIEELIVAFDMEKVERIILNLVSNAIKFRKHQSGEIFISLKNNKDFVTISVRDNGIGISKENLDKIFGKFVRLNDERTIIKDGTGIGLSLVESLTKLHGGNVSVDSSFGNWTEFKVQIPNILCNKKKEFIIDSKNLDRVEKIKIEFSDIYN